jgi:hypothetical protein
MSGGSPIEDVVKIFLHELNSTKKNHGRGLGSKQEYPKYESRVDPLVLERETGIVEETNENRLETCTLACGTALSSAPLQLTGSRPLVAARCVKDARKVRFLPKDAYNVIW